MGKRKGAAPEPLRDLEIARCTTGYLVRVCRHGFFSRDECVCVQDETWAFTTMNEALGFIRRRMKGADG